MKSMFSNKNLKITQSKSSCRSLRKKMKKNKIKEVRAQEEDLQIGKINKEVLAIWVQCLNFMMMGKNAMKLLKKIWSTWRIFPPISISEYFLKLNSGIFNWFLLALERNKLGQSLLFPLMLEITSQRWS